MALIQLIPNVSVGEMKFGEPIAQYLHLEHELHPLVVQLDESSYEDLYKFTNPPLSVFVNNNGLISSVSCYSYCNWKGVELIGLPFDDFQMLIDAEPDEEDEFYQPGDEGDSRSQAVYDYIDYGLQIWTTNNVIVTVGCTNYDLEF